MVSVIGVTVPAVTLNVKVVLEPGATLEFVQPIDPVVVQDHPPEATGVKETKVVLAGNTSAIVAVAQLLGPLFVTVCV